MSIFNSLTISKNFFCVKPILRNTFFAQKLVYAKKMRKKVVAQKMLCATKPIVFCQDLQFLSSIILSIQKVVAGLISANSSANFPSECKCVDKTPSLFFVADTTAAPAPSPNITDTDLPLGDLSKPPELTKYQEKLRNKNRIPKENLHKTNPARHLLQAS